MNTNESSKSNNGSISRLIKTGSGKAFGFTVNSSTDGEIALIDSTTNDGVASKAQTQLFLLDGFTPSCFALNAIEVLGGNVSDGDTFQLGNVVYTFRDTMTQPFDVQIEATIENSLANMSDATRGVNIGTSCYEGTTPQGQLCYFYDPLDSESSTTVSLGRETFYNNIPVIITSSVLNPSGDKAGSFAQAIPKEEASFTLGSKTYSFTAVLTDDVCGIFGIPTPPNTENEITDGGSLVDNIQGAINGDGGALEGTGYSFGTTPNAEVDCEIDGTNVYFKAKEVGSYGNSIVAKGNSATVGLGQDQQNLYETLYGGQDAPNSFMGSFPFTSGSSIVKFPAPIEFYQGLYAVVDGDIDYTILYE